ncbi:MAG: aspartate dehydrogenase domain-containing protein [Candidatus Latescibacterota bacterium]|nr:aspartate dehydrogenase domain-containing protein [Candidatus Latescibacterota bacterium]
MTCSARIGIVGYGYIGNYVYEQITTRNDLDLDIAFVYNRSRDRIAELPQDHRLDNLGDFSQRNPDLVVELAHPDVTREHGEAFLAVCDYMPLSLTAFADAELEDQLLSVATMHSRRIFVPHGAVIGLDALEEGRDSWTEVSIVMTKPVRSLDFSAAPQFDPEQITEKAVLFDGTAREICPLFPRNVNSHAAVALAGIGFDRTRSVLIADPLIDASIIELEAQGSGVEVKVLRENPMKGVSGVMTLMSCLASIGRAKAGKPGLRVC